MIEDAHIWQAKVLAWTHDPAEKALVLLRDPSGHEGGTVADLRKELFPGEVPSDLKRIVERADRWAAAADRPQFPRVGDGGPFEAWAQVRFEKDPEIIHPLSGDRVEMGDFRDVLADHVKAVSLAHFKDLIVASDEAVDWRRTLFSFWRFGPVSPARGLGALWGLLPADTRVPDHTIWAHLDLASAFSGAFAADPEGSPALLAVSIGPVQSFITQSRTTSDLWAGSHLLSMISWEAMKVVCERCGPDAVIFPQLRGVPIVDLWMHREVGISIEHFKDPEWKRRESDANPLFSAALPNKFVAIVPENVAPSLAKEIDSSVRRWVKSKAEEAVSMLLKEGHEEVVDDAPWRVQIKEQLSGFPEVHWSVVPWSLIHENAKGLVENTRELAAVMSRFYPNDTKSPGFLGTRFWKLLSGAESAGIGTFFTPNPGVLYPAVYDLADRVLSAAKSVRSFDQSAQEGFRCSLCGEREWLTTNRDELRKSPGDRGDTLWANVGKKKSSWARRGEHLCALCTLKRLWPSVFVQEIKEGIGLDVDRYVVSTHTMAVATTLERWIHDLMHNGMDESRERVFMAISSQVSAHHGRAALPIALHRRVSQLPESEKLKKDFVYGLPATLDDLREKAKEADQDGRDGERQYREFEKGLEDLFGRKPEAYYALILMDGDKMGAWISGSDAELGLSNEKVWHSQIREYVRSGSGDPQLKEYIAHNRPPSPSKHSSISAALNAFSIDLSRRVVEEVLKGKLLYSGGDDLLAMVSVDDVLPAMLLLRMAYSGIGIRSKEDGIALGHWLGIRGLGGILAYKGYVLLGKRLLRVMGHKATASFGAVVAHHTAPLGGVLSELRGAEKRAKNEGDRDAFSITLMKRAGGRTHLTLPWFVEDGAGDVIRQSPMGVLLSIRKAFADEHMSRRAAYLIQDWVKKLPSSEMVGGDEGFKKMLAMNVAYHFRRQCREPSKRDTYGALGPALAEIALRVKGRVGKKDEKELVHELLTVAEFLAREGRFEPPKLEAKEDKND